MVVPRRLLVEKVIKDERKVVLALTSLVDAIKRNQGAVEKLNVEISCRIILISQTQLDNEKERK